jgi:RNA polymerase sigma-70 factor, ECF subfamily
MTRDERKQASGLCRETQEQEILAQLAAGDRRNLGSLLDFYGADLMSYLHAVTGNHELAEDVFQDTWIRVMERIRRFDARRGFAPWLFRIARNLAYDRLRARRWKSRFGIGSASREDQVLDVAAPGDFREAMISEDLTRALLVGLDPVLREAIWLRYFQDMSYEQIAAHCRLPLGTVKSRLARALDQLGNRYQRLKGVAHD